MKKQQGLGLTELFMVIIVGAGILLLSIRQYQSYRADADIYTIKSNVDMLFQGLSRYYQVNCYGSTNPTATTNPVTPGKLNPASTPPNQQPIDIITDLVTPGLLTSETLANFTRSPIVDDSAGPTNTYSGYVLQFNQELPSASRLACTAGTNAIGDPFPPQCTATQPVGTIQSWSAQVAVLLKDTAYAQQYLGLLGGDCLSSLAGTIVLPCSANSPGPYVVWMRQPSYASTNAVSDYWTTNPTVKQFNQMYTTAPLTTLTDQSLTSTQHYMCGN
jgi:Tfp pilus assembly protein PilE